MARYRKIDPRIWNDAKFSALSDKGKLAFFMLLTHPNMTSIGAMRGTLPGLASELGWKTEAFAEAFDEVLSKGMAEHDAKSCFIALPKFIQYNLPESPNVVKAWVGSLDLLPECTLKNRVIARARVYAEGLNKGFAEALPDAFGKALPIPEQEQEPKQKKSKDYCAAPVSQSPAVVFIPTNTSNEFAITEDHVSEFKAAYPAVDVMQELRGMRAWSVANASKRKTRSGMLRFVNGWLSKAQNRPVGRSNSSLNNVTPDHMVGAL